MLPDFQYTDTGRGGLVKAGGISLHHPNRYEEAAPALNEASVHLMTWLSTVAIPAHAEAVNTYRRPVDIELAAADLFSERGLNVFRNVRSAALAADSYFHGERSRILAARGSSDRTVRELRDAEIRQYLRSLTAAEGYRECIRMGIEAMQAVVNNPATSGPLGNTPELMAQLSDALVEAKFRAVIEAEESDNFSTPLDPLTRSAPDDLLASEARARRKALNEIGEAVDHARKLLSGFVTLMSVGIGLNDDDRACRILVGTEPFPKNPEIISDNQLHWPGSETE